MKKVLKNKLAMCVLVLVVICLGTVVADDVIVKEGTIGVRHVSPTPIDETQKVLTFISDGASDVEYGYGLLTVTSDASNGTKNYYGTMCEYFPDATTMGYIRTGAGFFTRPVGTEAAASRAYYGLYSDISAMAGYSTDGKTVYLTGLPHLNFSPIFGLKTMVSKLKSHKFGNSKRRNACF